ncbi:universal stress protein [Sporomusa sp. KB1]|uniref:universal stress protein n=1 Tax=Sporomusa sp. KB1 TaxID=943346 RepID=UPI001C979495|nr:universal stress protein [Sporomusa sp. KB1]
MERKVVKILLYSKVLGASDGSDLAPKALEKAMEFAKLDSSMQLEIVHVMATSITLYRFRQLTSHRGCHLPGRTKDHCQSRVRAV